MKKITRLQIEQGLHWVWFSRKMLGIVDSEVGKNEFRDRLELALKHCDSLGVSFKLQNFALWYGEKQKSFDYDFKKDFLYLLEEYSW